jgi:hypothetical protein
VCSFPTRFARLRIGAALFCGLALVAACGEEPRTTPGLQARVFVDRTETRVGTPIGVTVEMEVPPGFDVDSPSPPPPDDRFHTESVEPLDPELLSAGSRHAIRWTLRARAAGDQQLPELLVPLVRPDGEVEPVPVGRLPIRVASTLEEFPERETYFDIRPAPDREPAWPASWTAGAAAAALSLAGLVFFLVRARRRRTPELDLCALAERCIGELEASLAEPDPRALAGRVDAALRGFVTARFAIDTRARTPRELPAQVDRPLVDLLAGIDGARFRRSPEREHVLALARDARGFLAGVGQR